MIQFSIMAGLFKAHLIHFTTLNNTI